MSTPDLEAPSYVAELDTIDLRARRVLHDRLAWLRLRYGELGEADRWLVECKCCQALELTRIKSALTPPEEP